MEENLLEKINLNGEILTISDIKARNDIETLNSSLSAVAKSGSYNDLTSKPNIPSFTYGENTLIIIS